MVGYVIRWSIMTYVLRSIVLEFSVSFGSDENLERYPFAFVIWHSRRFRQVIASKAFGRGSVI